jgi:hypothetical protein
MNEPLLPSSDTCYICTCDDPSGEEGLGNLITIICQKTEENKNCTGTRIHDKCLKQWIQNQPNTNTLLCLSCHHGYLIIPPRLIPRPTHPRINQIQYTGVVLTTSHSNDTDLGPSCVKCLGSLFMMCFLFYFIFTFFPLNN